MALAPALVLFAGLALAALVAAEDRARVVFLPTKPLATLSLIAVVGFPPRGPFASLVLVGLLLSACGDAALIWDGRRALIAGIALFLLAHGAYTYAFLGPGQPGFLMTAPLGLVVLTIATLWLVRRLWAGIEPGMRGPVAFYAAVITLMAGVSYFVLAGPAPERFGLAVASGAVLFYLSDAILAWRLFRADPPGAQTIGLAFYWIGQLGLALAARLSGA